MTGDVKNASACLRWLLSRSKDDVEKISIGGLLTQAQIGLGKPRRAVRTLSGMAELKGSPLTKLGENKNRTLYHHKVGVYHALLMGKQLQESVSTPPSIYLLLSLLRLFFPLLPSSHF